VWEHHSVQRLLMALVACSLIASACGASADSTPIEMPDWQTIIDATRAIEPVQVTVEVLVELDEEAAGGSAITGVGDWSIALADITLFEPLTDTALSRVVVNGDVSYVLSSAPDFTRALPEGREIVRVPTAQIVESGMIPDDIESLTGVLGLLSGARNAMHRNDGSVRVDIDLAAAVAAMTANESDGLDVAFTDLTDVVAVSDVTLSADASTIERFRVRIEANQNDAEFLLTASVDVTAVDSPLRFDPPVEALVVDLADVPAIRPMLTR